MFKCFETTDKITLETEYDNLSNPKMQNNLFKGSLNALKTKVSASISLVSGWQNNIYILERINFFTWWSFGLDVDVSLYNDNIALK